MKVHIGIPEGTSPEVHRDLEAELAKLKYEDTEIDLCECPISGYFVRTVDGDPVNTTNSELDAVKIVLATCSRHGLRWNRTHSIPSLTPQTT